MHRSRALLAHVLSIALLIPAISCARPPRGSAKPAGPAGSSMRIEDVSRVGSLEIRREDYPALPMLRVPTADAPAHVKAIYRIKPDRRVLYAVAEISMILSGKSAGPISLRVEADRWQVSLGGEAVGTLPELPSYDDQRRLLADWAGKQLRKHAFTGKLDAKAAADLAALEPELGSGHSRRTLEALGKLNEVWRGAPGAPDVLRLAARGYAWLSVQLTDDLDQAEALLGRALAFVILADTVSPGRVKAEEALLAFELGYESEARRLAEELPSSAERAYILERDTVGKPAAETRSAREATEPPVKPVKQSTPHSPEGGALLPNATRPSGAGARYLERLAAASNPDTFDPSSVGGAVSDLKAVRRAKTFASSMPTEDAMLQAVWDEIGLSLDGPPESRLGDLEKRLASQARSLAGPVLDEETYLGFYRGAVFTAVLGKAVHLLDIWGVTEAGEEYARSLDPASTTAAEIRDWIEDRVACRRDGSKVDLLNDDFSSLSRLGLFPLGRIRYSVALLTTPFTFVQRKGMPAYFRHLDSRPRGLLYAAEAARWNLHDLDLEEKLLRALDREAPSQLPASTIRLAVLTRDLAGLRQVASGSGRVTGARVRSLALEGLAQIDPSSGALVLEGFRQIVAAVPQDDSAALTGAKTLEEKLNDPARALELIRSWRSRRTGAEDLSWVSGVVAEARLLRVLGRHAEAHRTVQKVVSSWKESALSEGVECLVAVGQLEGALVLARQCLERYPEGATGYALTAGVLWRLDRDEEAAEVLKSGAARYESSAGWLIGDTLTKAFEKKTFERTSLAVSALRKAGFQGKLLRDILQRLTAGNDPRKAFEILRAAPLEGEFASAARIDAYKELAEAEGAEAGLTWMRSVTPGYDLQLAVVLMQWGPHELFLDLFSGNAQAEKQGFYLTMRAATLVYLKKGNDPRREEILRGTRESGPDDAWATLSTRYILHAVEESALSKEFGNEREISLIGWIRALRALETGRFRDANAWLQVAQESAEDNYPPKGFALSTLHRWQQAEKSLDLLQSEGVF